MDETNTDFREEKRKSLDDILRKGFRNKEIFETLFNKPWEDNDFETLSLMEYALSENDTLGQIIENHVWGGHGFINDALTKTGERVAPTVNMIVNNAMAAIQDRAETYCNRLVFYRIDRLPHNTVPKKVQEEMFNTLSTLRDVKIADYSKAGQQWMIDWATILHSRLRAIESGSQKSANTNSLKKYTFIDHESHKLLREFKRQWTDSPSKSETKRAFTSLLARHKNPNEHGIAVAMDELRPHLVDAIEELRIDPETYVEFLISLSEWQQNVHDYTEKDISIMLYGALRAISIDWYEMPEGVKNPRRFFKRLFSFIISVPVNIDTIRQIMDVWTMNKDLVIDVMDVLYNKPIYCAPLRHTIRIPTNYVNEGSFRIHEYLMEYVETLHDFRHIFEGAELEEYHLMFPHLVGTKDSAILLNGYRFAEKYHNEKQN